MIKVSRSIESCKYCVLIDLYENRSPYSTIEYVTIEGPSMLVYQGRLDI
jgi:hypothetical protein